MSAILRNVYVPAADRRARSRATREEPLPRETAVQATRLVFRGIPWEGAAAPAPVSGAESRVEPATSGAADPVRRFYGLIPWDGARQEAPRVAAQEKKSVGSILGSFNWEKGQL